MNKFPVQTFPHKRSVFLGFETYTGPYIAYLITNVGVH